MKKNMFLGCGAALALALYAVPAFAQVTAEAASDADFYYRYMENGSYTQSYPKICYNGFTGALKSKADEARAQFSSVADTSTPKGKPNLYDREGNKNVYSGNNYYVPVSFTDNFSTTDWGDLLPVEKWTSDISAKCLRPDFAKNRDDLTVKENGKVNVDKTNVNAFNSTTNVISTASETAKLPCGMPKNASLPWGGVKIGKFGTPECSDGTYAYKVFYDNTGKIIDEVTAKLSMGYGDAEAKVPLRECFVCRTTSNDTYCEEVIQEIAKAQCVDYSKKATEINEFESGTNYIKSCDDQGIVRLVKALAKPRDNVANAAAALGSDQMLPVSTTCETCLARAEELISKRLP